MELVQKKYTGAQVTKDMVRKWKEEFSYVNGDDREQMVELSVEEHVVDIGDAIKAACSMVVGNRCCNQDCCCILQTLNTNQF